MRNFTITALLLAMLVLCAGCEKQGGETTKNVRQEPVVVYAAFEDDARLRELFETYTEETGVLVIVRRGERESIVNDLIENRISPPADVLITQSVAGVWRAAEEGALRPLYSNTVRERSPAWSRDPDDLWFGTGFRTAVIVVSQEAEADTGLPGFAALAEQRFAGQLCLSSSTNQVNRTVVAMMIATMDARPAELAVRGWMKNLARPVVDTEADVIAAIRSGKCRYAIVSSTAFANALADDPRAEVSAFTPDVTFADIDGVGVARHARNPEGAAKLVEWLFSADVQEEMASQNRIFPADQSAAHDDALESLGAKNVSPKNVGLVAWHEIEAAKLAERARYP
jgi:iron(III) transport system substrate-binding protein